MEVYSNTKIYIFCPEKAVSGGPDALHQLYYYLRQCSYDANLVYFFSENTQCEERFEKYDPKIISYKEMIDSEENIIVMPESATYALKRYKNMRKCIWWLGYYWYDGKRPKCWVICRNMIKFVLNRFKRKDARKYVYEHFAVKITKDMYHFCGSQYVYDILTARKFSNVEMLVEPLSLDFINRGMADDLTSANRSDLIPYNPAKPSRIMKKLLLRSDLRFIPIKGMPLSQVIDLFRRSKLYIDFGKFGGPERLPKESVYNGTCLLVGKRNAAVNDFDVAIPAEFKIADYNNEELVVARIKDVLTNYDAYIAKFQHFREKIDNLESNFIQAIKDYFVKTN